MVILHPPHSPNPTDCILLYCTIPPRYVYPSTPARHITPACTHTHHIAIHITLTHRPCCTPSLTMCTHPTRLAISHPHAHPHITSHPLAVAALLLLMLPLHMLCCYCCRCRRCTATAAVAALLLLIPPARYSPSLHMPDWVVCRSSTCWHQHSISLFRCYMMQWRKSVTSEWRNDTGRTSGPTRVGKMWLGPVPITSVAIGVSIPVSLHHPQCICLSINLFV